MVHSCFVPLQKVVLLGKPCSMGPSLEVEGTAGDRHLYKGLAAGSPYGHRVGNSYRRNSEADLESVAQAGHHPKTEFDSLVDIVGR